MLKTNKLERLKMGFNNQITVFYHYSPELVLFYGFTLSKKHAKNLHHFLIRMCKTQRGHHPHLQGSKAKLVDNKKPVSSASNLLTGFLNKKISLCKYTRKA